MKPIVLLSGPVGAGKSTVARALIECSPEPLAYIEGDSFWPCLAKGAASIGRKTNFKTIMASMTAAAVPLAVAGYEVILDFSIPPWYLDTARKIAGTRDVPLDYVAIVPSEKICAERAAKRAAGAIADYAPYRDLYADFARDDRHAIRDDKADAAAVAMRIREGLDSGTFRLS